MSMAEVIKMLAPDAPSFDPQSITGLTADSRKVEPGFVFAALKGTRQDGGTFAGDAAAKGARAILAGRDAALPDFDVPVIRVDDTRRALALMAAAFYARQPKTIAAVTGTSGKTSVAAFTRQIWQQAGHDAASIGTTGVTAPGVDRYGALTTPDPVALHALLKELADRGIGHAAMEASSHGLDQRRLDGVRIAVAGFTNLGRDHMDYHPTMDDYHQAKMRLFDTLLPKSAPAIIFADDAWSPATVMAAKAAGADVRTVGRGGDFLTLKRVEYLRDHQRAEIVADGDIHEITIPLAGEFQIFNALVAAGMAIATGTPADKALAALKTLEGAPGRLDLAGRTGENAPVYVDYAHKPDALENVLRSVRPFTAGRIVVVFGCGGDRDKGKRPMMGEIATRLADVTIVTDDNPRSEEPAAIRAEIMAAAPGAREIGDRAEAIRAAVAMLDEGDTLIVAGKGHEDGQTIGDETIAFSDHAHVRAALQERGQ